MLRLLHRRPVLLRSVSCVLMGLVAHISNVEAQWASPSATEVLSAERPATQPSTTPPSEDRGAPAPSIGSATPSSFGPPLDEPLDPAKYVCGRGDTLELNFWGSQNFKVRVTLDPEGRAFLPRIGPINVLGRSLTDARALIRAAVLKTYPGLSFDLSLASARAFTVHVADNVKNPGSYTSTPFDRVWNVLKAAGGSTGSMRRVSVHRRDGTVLEVDLLRYTLLGDKESNPYVQDGDVIRVPFEDVVAAAGGAVRRHGRFELIRGRDIAELIELAGGLGPEATRLLPIRILRLEGTERRTIELSFPPEGLPNAPLQREDIVVVPNVEELQQSVFVSGAIAGGGPTVDQATIVKRLTFIDGEKVSHLVERAGGTAPNADLARSSIQAFGGRDFIPLDLEALLVRRDRSVDRAVIRGDTVIIPVTRRGVAVNGAVFSPNVYPFNPSFTVDQYITAAGGLTRQARSRSGVVLLSPDGQRHAWSSTLAPHPGDTIVVPEREFSPSELVTLVIGGVSIAVSVASLLILAARR